VKKAKVLFKSIEKVKDFIKIASELDCDLDLSMGRKVIDGKSIMGILSLDISQAIDMNIHAKQDSEQILKALQEFII
jgi:phosphotransferase system HPr-like phosphotransfer protein